MAATDYSLAEKAIIGELADTVLFGAHLDALDILAVDGRSLASGLQEMFDARVLTAECNEALLQALKEKLKPLTHSEALLLLESEKGRGRIKWTRRTETGH